MVMRLRVEETIGPNRIFKRHPIDEWSALIWCRDSKLPMAVSASHTAKEPTSQKRSDQKS
jgi:hypothetical protein